MLKRKNMRISGLALLLAGFLLLSGLGNVKADEVKDWPKRPIEWVLAVSPGGGTDIFARKISTQLKDIWGVDIRVKNMPGESTSYAIEQPADGYTWTATDEIAIAPVYIEGTNFNLETWCPIAIVQQDPRWIVALKDSDFENMKEVIEYAKDNRVNVGGVSPFGPDACLVYFLNKYAGTNFNYIPYNSTAEVITAAKGGVLGLMAGSLVSFVSELKADGIDLFMVSAEERVERFPDVPTAKELGYDVVTATYRGIGVSCDTPEEIKNKIAEAVAEAVEKKAYQEYEKSQYLDLIPGVLYFDDARKRLENVYDYTSEVYEAKQK